MNRKIVLLPLILLLLFGISACSANSSPSESTKALDEKGKNVSSEQNHSGDKNFSYKIIDETYTEDGIKLVYPQLSNASHHAKSDSINKAIQRDILMYLESLKENGEDSGKVTLDMKYEMKGYPDKTISIAYIGVYTDKDAAYPTNIYHTQNIEIETSNTLSLNTVINIDSFFVKIFKKGMYSPYSDDLDLEESGVNIKEELEELYSDEDLINLFKNDNCNYILADQGVIVSVEVPHVLGDHLEMAFNYEWIESNIIKENSIWKDYLFLDNETQN